jgi:Ni,Fe-hydrogenase I large subunit
MATEGELVVRIDWDAGHVKRVQARSQRPRVARTILPGRSPGEAVALVTTLFAICGRSQGIAAAAATDAARLREPSPSLTSARERRIVAETVHEHFWRVLVDWPRLAFREPETAPMGAVRRALVPWLDAAEGDVVEPSTQVAAVARQSVFGRDAGEWLAIATLDELAAWWRGGGTPVARVVGDLMLAGPAVGQSDVALLAPVDGESLVGILEPAICAEEDFDEAPHWRGEARETGALARVQSHPLVAAAQSQWGRGLGARAVARLVDLAQLVQVLAGHARAGRRHGASPVAAGAGISWVETARGLLVHRARVENERITEYRIVAPTEWNFHPRGPFVRGALALAPATPEALQLQANWIVASLDPCVPWRVEVGRA